MSPSVLGGGLKLLVQTPCTSASLDTCKFRPDMSNQSPREKRAYAKQRTKPCDSATAAGFVVDAVLRVSESTRDPRECDESL